MRNVMRIQENKKSLLNWFKTDDVSLEIRYTSARKKIFKAIKNKDWERACTTINCQLGFQNILRSLEDFKRNVNGYSL